MLENPREMEELEATEFCRKRRERKWRKSERSEREVGEELGRLEMDGDFLFFYFLSL